MLRRRGDVTSRMRGRAFPRYSESASVHVTPLLSVDSGRDELCRPQSLWQLGEAVASAARQTTRDATATQIQTRTHAHTVSTPRRHTPLQLTT